MPQRFDPAELEPVLRAHPMRVLRRLWLLVRLVAIFLLAGWWGRQQWLPQDDATRLARQRRAAQRFRNALVDLGPTFIKIGQMLSTRPDMLPLEFISELTALQDRVPPFDTAIALSTIKQELGRDVTDLFSEFDVRPISAASIGQVYRAKLVTGEDVVLKVQRPHLDSVIRLDLGILRRLATWAMGKDLTRYGVPLAKDMPYVAILDRFAQSLYDQIDFVQEAENIETFRRNFRDFPMVTAPKPYWDFTTARVLTEEYIEGFKFDDYEGITGAGLDYVEIANLGVRSFIKQVLEDGYFHADTHPGNVLIRPSGEVVYIDFGMVDTIPPDSQSHLVDLFVHLVHLNFDGFISDLVALGFLPEEVERSVVLPIVEDIYTAQLGLGERTYSLKEILDRVSRVMYDYPFYLPERFAFLMRSVSSMEGVVLAHVPTYKFLNVGLPFAGKLMLNPDQRVIRDKLISELMAGDTLHLDRLLELFEFASREPTFRIGDLAAHAMAYMLSEEARRFRRALTLSVLTPEMVSSEGTLDRILERVLRDPSLDLFDLFRPIGAFIQTPEGLEWLEIAVPRLRHLTPNSALSRLFPLIVSRLLDGRDLDSLLTELVPALEVMISDRALSLQPAVDWLAAWVSHPTGRMMVGDWAALATEISPQLRNDLLYLALLTLQHPELDLSPLIGAFGDFMTSPEAHALREIGMDWFATGEVDQALFHLLQRTFVDRALRSEVVGALMPTLRFLSSPEASSTRLRMLEVAWRRLASWFPAR